MSALSTYIRTSSNNGSWCVSHYISLPHYGIHSLPIFYSVLRLCQPVTSTVAVMLCLYGPLFTASLCYSLSCVLLLYSLPLQTGAGGAEGGRHHSPPDSLPGVMRAACVTVVSVCVCLKVWCACSYHLNGHMAPQYIHAYNIVLCFCMVCMYVTV